MNLYEFSQEKNDEMGILVTKKEDQPLYAAIYEQAIRWKDNSDNKRARTPGKRRPKSKPVSKGLRSTQKERPTLRTDAKEGFCIRCKVSVSFKPEELRPYCYNCYTTWSEFENPEFKEQYCHVCGKKNSSSMLKPLCRSCYRVYKTVFEK